MGRRVWCFSAIVTLGLAAAGSGCVKATTPAPLPFAFDARPTWGEIRVLPVVGVHEEVPVNLDSLFGADLTESRRRVRKKRTWQLDSALPSQVAWALPGALNGALGDSWGGQFISHRHPPGVRDRLTNALTGQRDLDATLGEVARTVGGNATLVCWVRSVHGEPLSVQGLPGQVVQTEFGPVVVDHDDEPYLVNAVVGMALVARDGEVVVRYEDTFGTLLSARQGPEYAARDLAAALADEVVKVWAVDPRLHEHEPERPAPVARTRPTLSPPTPIGPTAFAPTFP